MSDFRAALEAAIPALRRYARALTRDAEIADDPAHSEIKKPRDTTSPRAPRSMSAIVGSMISCTTLGEKTLFDIDPKRCSITDIVSGVCARFSAPRHARTGSLWGRRPAR